MFLFSRSARPAAIPSFSVHFLVFTALALPAALLLPSKLLHAQATTTSGTILGVVKDESGAAIPNATIVVTNFISGLTRELTSDATGNYRISNLPYGNYHLIVRAQGFANNNQDVDLHSPVPESVSWSLVPGASSVEVNVHGESTDLTDKTSLAQTSIDTSALAHVASPNSSSGVNDLITLSTPGIAQDSNGMFHPQGEHADTSYSIDGQPVTDQQSRAFSNQMAASSIQSMQVISGVAPAEYGDKASLVVETTTRSGLGSSKAHGSLMGSYGSFGTSSGSFSLGYGSQAVGTFTAIDVLNSGRFLDTPEFTPIHAHGNAESIFERLDWHSSDTDSGHLNLNFGRSWLQVPNQYDQEAAGQDQRQQIKNFNIAPSFTHLINASSLVTAALWFRQDQVHYYPSHDIFSDTPTTLASSRRLTNMGAKVDYAYSKGIHSLKAGVIFTHTPLSESFSIGITDPAYNAPCLAADGTPITDTTVGTDCSGEGQQANPNYLAGEAGFDLTRGGSLLSLGGTTDIKEESVYIQDELHMGQWTASLGIRADNYTGISSRSMVEPRLGVSYTSKPTGTTLRASWGKFFLTPYNENLIVSSSTGLGGLGNDLGDYGQSALKPGSRNHFTTGIEQAVGHHIAIQADYFWKFTDRDYDFDIILNTPLTFPIQWRKSKIDGFALRVNLTPIHGVSAYMVAGHSRSRFFGPEVGGILFNNPDQATATAPFRIDHDQAFQQTTHLQWQPRKEGPWYAMNWTYESGLVAGDAPVANDTTTPVDLTYLTADQQQQAQITCGQVRATLATPLTSCAPSQLSSRLLSLPGPGTADDDLNPPRVAPRHVFDMVVGYDNLFRGNRVKTNLTFTATNITNKYALYNFLSTFSGTHFLTPRSLNAQLSLVF